MLIGEIAKKTGLSRDTIRYYEKFGLIKMLKKGRKENNYRDYTEDDLQRLQLIILLKEYGFTLMDIRSILKHLEEDRDEAYKEMPNRIKSRLEEIENKIAELLSYKRNLELLLKEFSE